MTYLGGLGCTLIGLGPCLILFLCTVASCPIRVILLTARKAESGLQLIVGNSTTSRPPQLDGNNVDGIINNSRRGEGPEVNEAPHLIRNRKQSGSNTVLANDYDNSTGVQIIVGDNNNNIVQLDHRTVAYVSGLGYGLMSCIIQLLRILIDSYGPGIFMYSTWDSKTFFLFASCQCMCISMLQVFWSLILFTGFVQRVYSQIIFVYSMHFGLAALLVEAAKHGALIHREYLNDTKAQSYKTLLDMPHMKVRGDLGVAPYNTLCNPQHAQTLPGESLETIEQ
ncbi:Gamma-secretase subunit APH-1B [Schistosoma japonicum]|nr:Gamma-secretase subunit APH-1B [Schistosoma japonicum]KAH8870151.1 Gamma-secretase subunit APH-1B [Schistosoma japonicum]